MYVELLSFTLLTITFSVLDVGENGCETLSNQTFSSYHDLRKTMDCFLEEMMEIEKDDLLLGKEGDIKSDLLAETSSTYKIYSFGSRAMGLGLKTSDCDLFVDVGDCYTGGRDAKTKKDCMNAASILAKSIARHNHSFYDIRYIPKARVPILKIVHRNTDIHVDISTRNGIGIENSRLVRGYFADPRVKFVGAAVKMWSRSEGLAKTVVGTGAFSSYAMLWLVLFSLMHYDPPAISTTAQLKRVYTGPQLVVDGWDCGHCSATHPKVKNNKSEVELLRHFFEFYSKMSVEDLKGGVVCPYTGTLIPRAQFRNTISLPREFQNYKDQVADNKAAYEMVCNTSLCIQDPVEQGNNVAKNVEDWAISKFLSSC